MRGDVLTRLGVEEARGGNKTPRRSAWRAKWEGCRGATERGVFDWKCMKNDSARKQFFPGKLYAARRHAGAPEDVGGAVRRVGGGEGKGGRENVTTTETRQRLATYT